MALLLIKATAVPPSEFEGWLQGLAQRLERCP
jgi:hypothetical protein